MECFKRAGKALPDYPSSTDGGENKATALKAMANGWVREESPKFGLAAQFRTTNGPHVGFMLDAHQFLHIVDSCRACIERVDDPGWSGVLVGFYAWPTS